MPLKSTIEKLNDYYERLDNRKAKRIKPKHIEKMIAKLKAKEAELDEAIEGICKPEKRERLRQKRSIVTDQIRRAEFLLDEIRKPS